MKSTHAMSLLTGVVLASIVFLTMGIGVAPRKAPAKNPEDPEVAPAQAQPNLPPGRVPYTPTRIEWLAVVANTQFGIPARSGAEAFRINYRASGKTRNSITINCVYKNTVHRPLMNEHIAGSRLLLESEAKRRGWDKWLKIEERVALVKFE